MDWAGFFVTSLTVGACFAASIRVAMRHRRVYQRLHGVISDERDLELVRRAIVEDMRLSPAVMVAMPLGLILLLAIDSVSWIPAYCGALIAIWIATLIAASQGIRVRNMQVQRREHELLLREFVERSKGPHLTLPAVPNAPTGALSAPDVQGEGNLALSEDGGGSLDSPEAQRDSQPPRAK